VKCILIPSVWNQDSPEEVIIPSGVVDFKYQSSASVNMFFPRAQQTKQVVFAQGTPLLQMIPLTERKIDCKFHLVSTQDLQNLDMPVLWFQQSYKKHKAAKGKCPMHTNFDTRNI
jgi:hypothetical protein